MKKYLTLLLFLLIFLIPAMPKAHAAYDIVVRIENDNVYAYKNPSHQSEKLFMLEKTYFALVESVNQDFYALSYAENLTGYVPVTCYIRKSDCKIYTGTRPNPIYPSYTATASLGNTLIFDSPTTSGGVLAVLVKGQTVNCYGLFSNDLTGEYFVYCKSGNNYGYIECFRMQIENLPPHPIPIEEEKPVINENNQNGNVNIPLSGGVQIFLILAITIPTLIIIYACFKPQK